MALHYTATSESLTVVHQEKTYTVRKGAANFLPLRTALLEEDWASALEHLTVPKSLSKWSKGKFRIENGDITFSGEAIPKSLSDRIAAMAEQGEDPTPLLKFWEKVQKNPSHRSVHQLFDFLQHADIALDEEGNVLA